MFYLIVGLLLNWNLVPEQNAMSTLVEISEHVAEELGRPELVADWNGGDYTPTNKFRRIINRAHRRLDRAYSVPRELSEYTEAVTAGDYTLDAPDEMRFVTRIDLVDSDGNIVPEKGLKLRRLAWLRDKYGEEFDQVDQAQPEFWARGIGTGLTSQLCSDPTFSNPLADGVSGMTEIDDLSDGVFAANDRWCYGAFVGGAYQFSARSHVEDIQVSASWDAGETQPTTISVLAYDSISGNTYEGYGSANPDAAPGNPGVAATVTVTFDVNACITAFAFQYTASTPTIDYFYVYGRDGGSIEHSAIVILPPADASYTAHIYGGMYTERMVENADVTWWSDRHPEILELAIKRQVAKDLNRNQTEVNEYDMDILSAIDDIETDAALEDQNYCPAAERRFGSAP